MVKRTVQLSVVIVALLLLSSQIQSVLEASCRASCRISISKAHHHASDTPVPSRSACPCKGNCEGTGDSCVGIPKDCIPDPSGAVAVISNISDKSHSSGAAISFSPVTCPWYPGRTISGSGKVSSAIRVTSVYLLNLTLLC